MGITFGGDFEPGIDVILPDIRFLEEERRHVQGEMDWLAEEYSPFKAA